MHPKNTLLNDVIEDGDDGDTVLSYDAWIRTLTGPAREELLNQRGGHLERNKGPKDDKESAGVTASSPILVLLTKVHDLLVRQRQVRDHYSTEQAALFLG